MYDHNKVFKFGNMVLRSGCYFLLVRNFSIHCQIFCVMTKVGQSYFFQWYDDETCTRRRKVLPGLYKQVNYLKGEVSLLRARPKIQTYILVFSLVISVLLFCHWLMRH
jgi:hypothetical protein